LFDITESGLRDEPPSDSLLRRLPKKIGRKPMAGAIVQRPSWFGDWNGSEPAAVFGWYVCVM